MSYASEVLIDSPSLYWRLGEASGPTVADSSGNGRTGTVTGGVFNQAGALYQDGNGALQLDGVDDRIDSIYNPFVNGTVRTFEGWAYRIGTTYDTLFSSIGGGVFCYLDNTADRINFDLNTAAGAGVAQWSWTWPGSDQWVHWVFVVDETANTLTLYLNGRTVGSVTQTDPYSGSVGNFRVGADQTGIYPFAGKLDEVAVYEYALSPARILAHYDANRPALTWPTPYVDEVLADSPDQYLRLGESTATVSGGTAQDASPNNNDGTYFTVGYTPSAELRPGEPGALPSDPDTCCWFGNQNNSRILTSYPVLAQGSVRTFEGWAWRQNRFAGDQLFASDGAATYMDLQLAAGSNNVTLRVDVTAAGGDQVWTAAWPSSAQWVHWALIVDDSAHTAELFVNGVSKGVKTSVEAAPASLGNITWGGRSSVAPWNGWQDEVAAYDYALSPSRIADHYNARWATGLTVHERSASLSASAAIAAAGQRDVQRSASLTAAGTIATSGQRDLHRSASLAASASTAVSGQRDVPRAVTLTAAAAVTGTGLTVLERAAAVAGAAAVEVRPQRDLQRSAVFTAAALVAVAHERELQRAVVLAATGTITSGGEVEQAMPQWSPHGTIGQSTGGASSLSTPLTGPPVA